MKKLFILLLVMFISNYFLSAQEWKLVKEKDGLKAFTKGDKFKSFKVVSMINASASSIHSFLIQYDKYPEFFEEMESIDVISQTATKVIYYLIIATPWPLENRDMVVQVDINKISENEIILDSKLPTKKYKENNPDYVRITSFKQKITLQGVSENKTYFTIEGTIDIGGNVPLWVQNKFMVEGPINMVDKIKEKCE